MRRYPQPDEIREAELEQAVREAIGASFRFLEDGPYIATLALTELWTFEAVGSLPGALRAFCSVMAMATDGLRAARATLLIHDLGGVFASLRRTDEMDTLAIALGLVPGERDRWLRGAQVSQADLRRRIELANPTLAAKLRVTHGQLSDQVHGRTQSLSVYENAIGEFAWPPIATDVDPNRIRAAYTTILSLLMSHLGVIRWQIQDWSQLSAELGRTVPTFYDALAEFVHSHVDHGTWQAIAPGHAADWLGIRDE